MIFLQFIMFLPLYGNGRESARPTGRGGPARYTSSGARVGQTRDGVASQSCGGACALGRRQLPRACPYSRAARQAGRRARTRQWPRATARSGPETAPCCSTPSGLRLLLPEARGRQPPRPHSRRPYGRSSQKPPSAASSRPLGLTAIFSQGETVHEKDWSTGLIRLCKFCRNDLIFSVN